MAKRRQTLYWFAQSMTRSAPPRGSRRKVDPLSAAPGSKDAAGIGVLIVNLGTPEATDYWSMRRYLKEFLSDRRVIETPPWIWWPILNLVILSVRPTRSGKVYRSIWNRERNESPLKTITRAQAQKLAVWVETGGVGLGKGLDQGGLGDALWSSGNRAGVGALHRSGMRPPARSCRFILNMRRRRRRASGTRSLPRWRACAFSRHCASRRLIGRSPSISRRLPPLCANSWPGSISSRT